MEIMISMSPNGLVDNWHEAFPLGHKCSPQVIIEWCQGSDKKLGDVPKAIGLPEIDVMVMTHASRFDMH